MSNVATHSRFRTDVASLRELAGVDIRVVDEVNDIDLEEPKYGETLLGDLTTDEKAIFIDMYRAVTQTERMAREFMGAAISRMGAAIAASDAHKPLDEAVRQDQGQLDFGSDENRLEFFRLQQRAALLKATLYWSLGERFGCHDFSIGVRTRYRAYKTKCRA